MLQHTTLTDLPQSVLHDILGRLPSSAKAVRMMGVCKALKDAVRTLPEVSVAMRLDLMLPMADTRRRCKTRQGTAAGTLMTCTTSPPAPSCKRSYIRTAGNAVRTARRAANLRHTRKYTFCECSRPEPIALLYTGVQLSAPLHEKDHVQQHTASRRSLIARERTEWELVWPHDAGLTP